MSKSNRQALITAIRATDPKYLTGVLESRTPFHPNQKGSCWIEEFSVGTLIDRIENTYTTPEPEEFTPEGGGYTPVPNHPCRYLRVDIEGWLGVMPLSDLDPETLVILLDPKGTCGSPGGGVQAHLVNGGKKLGWEEFSTFILGPDTDRTLEDGTHPYVLWTAHPGAPTGRYQPLDRADLVGKTVTAKEALELGLQSVNLR